MFMRGGKKIGIGSVKESSNPAGATFTGAMTRMVIGESKESGKRAKPVYDKRQFINTFQL